MRTHVTVDGITLSKSQVEKAVKRLTEPDVPQFGNIVKVKGEGQKEYLVLASHTELAALLDGHYTAPTSTQVRMTDGRDTWCKLVTNLTIVRKLKRS
jgi:hypothetical protein